MKKLSIGIVTYNNVPFIYNLIYEIKNQININPSILNNVDFFLYDDNSLNKKFITKLPEYFKIEINEKNSKSPAFGRNYIIDNANSEYILFIDGDDNLIRDISDLLKELNYKFADIIFSDVVKIDADGQYLNSPFIYSNLLFSKNLDQKILKKICVHQTGIWSIYNLQFLKLHNIKYIEDIRYEDNFFLFNILLKNPNIKTLEKPYYGWRNNYKSFSYSNDSLRHRILLYKKTIKLLEENMTNEFSPYIIFSIWNQTYSNIIRNYPKLNKKEAKKYFKELQTITKLNFKLINTLKNKIDHNYTDKYFKYSKYKIFQSFLIINSLKYYKYLKFNKNNIKKIILKAFKILPLNKNKIFLINQYGNYGSNPKYFYKELKEKNSNKKITFFVNDENLYNKKDFKNYNNRLSFYFNFYTAKNIYFDTWLDPSLSKRKNQVWTQMWHGYPYKKLYSDIKIYNTVNNKDKRIKKEKNILKWDFVYSLDQKNSKIFKHLFPSVQIVEKEYERITWLKKNFTNSKLKEEIRKKYNLKDKKYTLYAPTYRPYKVYLNQNQLDKIKASENEIIYHPHPMLKTNFKLNYKTLKNVDIQEILLIIDELITDYSSIQYDFLQINQVQSLKYYQPDKFLYSKMHGLY